MTLPPGFLDELRSRVPLSRVVGRKVTWDLRRSNQGKGDMWAPCPFHQERSASFHVDDRKGFYYCFGCQAKGDAVSFLKETENLSFLEAVEWLAREAGMPMPARDPQAAQKADRRTQLVAVMDEAIRHFRLSLRTAAAAEARDYLARRRLTPAAQDRFEIGFAPDLRQGLFQTLTQKGIAPDLIVDAGLCARPDDGGAPYDRFRGRIIFPIRDARGRAIRAGKGLPLIVAEGYMDVIALSEAGFRATVAPLGTAITEDQLRLIWRIHPEPVIALDGDKAGIAAALRLIDLALPLLEAGQGLRFSVLPGSMDPDDLIRTQGAAAMQKVIDSAEPMVRMLWARETEGKSFDSPDRKAALEKAVGDVLRRISDTTIRGHYAQEMRRLQWQLFNARPPRRPPGQAGAGGRRTPDPLPALAATRRSVLAGDGALAEEQVLEAVLLATLVTHPALIRRFEPALESLSLLQADHDLLRQVLLRHAHADPDRFAENIASDAGPILESLFARSHVRSAPPVRNRKDPDLAVMCLAEGLAKLEARRSARQEIEDAMEDMTGLADEGLTWRLSKAAEALQGPQRSNLEDASDMGEDRPALSRHLQDMIDARIWIKKKG